MGALQTEAFDAAAVRPYWLGDGPTGALLLHGFAGTPPELRLIGEALAGAGFRVFAPALAGHAATPEALESTGWREWAGSAVAALEALERECPAVAVIGQSMGGTLALHLAATRSEVRAVVTLAAPLWLRDWRLRVLPAARRVVRWHTPSSAVDLYHPEAINELISYPRRPTRSLVELTRLCRRVRQELPAVLAPTLVLHGGRDGVVDPVNADEIVGRVSSPVRALYRLERSGHALSVDVDRALAARLIVDWLRRYDRPDGDLGLDDPAPPPASA